MSRAVTVLAQDVAELTRDQARDAAREELSRPAYDEAQPSLVLRVVGRALRELAELLDRAASAAPGGALGLLLLAGLLVLAVYVVVARVRPRAWGQVPGPLFGAASPLTAAQHRELAEQAAAAGRPADAVRERLRAVVRELEARGVLDPKPGRTADEVAREAGLAVPEVAADLTRAAGVFDEIWYGGRPADDADYALLVDVDRRLLERRLVAR